MTILLKLDDTFRDAACVGLPVDQFYPKPSQSTDGPKRTCARCPVRDACLQHALEHDERYGIWGGTTPDERRDLTKERNP